jgi:hypothetical protein
LQFFTTLAFFPFSLAVSFCYINFFALISTPPIYTPPIPTPPIFFTFGGIFGGIFGCGIFGGIFGCGIFGGTFGCGIFTFGCGTSATK